MLFFGFGWVDASGSQSTAEKKKAPDLPICVVVEIGRSRLLRVVKLDFRVIMEFGAFIFHIFTIGGMRN